MLALRNAIAILMASERGGPITPGHRTPAAEIADLLARYPGTVSERCGQKRGEGRCHVS